MHWVLDSRFVNCNKAHMDCTRKGTKHFINRIQLCVHMVTAILPDNPEQSPNICQIMVA